jgi:hypothetical protein
LGGKAIVANAADFGARDGNPDVAVAGDLLFQLFVKAGFEFADFAATQTGDMDVVTRAVGFVIVAIAAEMKKIELVDETFFLEEVDSAIDGDQVDFGIDCLGALEDLVDVQVLFGRIHELKNDAALAGEANAAFTESVLEVAGGFGGVDAFAGGNAPGWNDRHGASGLGGKFSRCVGVMEMRGERKNESERVPECRSARVKEKRVGATIQEKSTGLKTRHSRRPG